MKIKLSFTSGKPQLPLAPIPNRKDYKLAIISKDAQILKLKPGKLQGHKPVRCIVVLNHPPGFDLIRYLLSLGRRLEYINSEMEIEIDTKEVEINKVQPTYFLGFN